MTYAEVKNVVSAHDSHSALLVGDVRNTLLVLNAFYQAVRDTAEFQNLKKCVDDTAKQCLTACSELERFKEQKLSVPAETTLDIEKIRNWYELSLECVSICSETNLVLEANQQCAQLIALLGQLTRKTGNASLKLALSDITADLQLCHDNTESTLAQQLRQTT